MLSDLTKIESDLQLGAVSSSIILDKLCVVDEDSRKSSSYVDSNYIPFYYHLGKYIAPKNFLEIGVNLGFFSSALFNSCKTIENYLAFQTDLKSFFSKRLMSSNIKYSYKKNFDFYFGKTEDKNFQDKVTSTKWDLVFLNEERYYDKYAEVLDLAWENLSDTGLIVMDNVITTTASRDAFSSFCKNKNFMIFKTRYGTGVVSKESS
jgi:predicted O-methyltransferase YrrM